MARATGGDGGRGAVGTSMKSNITYGWAVRIRTRPGIVSYLGVGWLDRPELWDRLAGHNLAIWPTRREAREFSRQMRNRPFYFEHTRIERVKIMVGPA